jgi:sulfur-oxidizing protein SoxB
MVRCGGIGYTIDISAPMGKRISNMKLLRTGETIDASKEYAVGGWASVNQGVEGPPIWDVVSDHIIEKKVISRPRASAIEIKGA